MFFHCTAALFFSQIHLIFDEECSSQMHVNITFPSLLLAPPESTAFSPILLGGWCVKHRAHAQ